MRDRSVGLQEELQAEHLAYLACNSACLREHGWSPLSSERPFPSSNSLLSFYSAHSGACSPSSSRILVNYLPSSSDSVQHFVSYACSNICEMDTFFDDLSEDRALIYQGTFAPFKRGDASEVLNAQSSSMKTLSCVCVDVDPLPDPVTDTKHPLASEACLCYLLDNTPSSLLPSFIALSGSGIHLWYVFSQPVLTFSKGTMRRRKLTFLQTALYRVFAIVTEGFPVQLDPKSQNLYHAFAAPGSLSKFGDPIPCFYNDSVPESQRLHDPNELLSTLRRYLGDSFFSRDVSDDNDLYLTPEELSLAWSRMREDALGRTATDRQRSLVSSLVEQGVITMSTDEVASLSCKAASEIISSYKRRPSHYSDKSFPAQYSSWKTKPHVLRGGSSGGVYSVILRAMGDVKVGNRYSAMNMLAGVAYMTVAPIIPVAQVRDDLLKLVNSPWGRRGEPLTERDVENALKGYCPENWQTIETEIAALGFSPFGASAKRNYRRREDHLRLVHEQKVVATIVRLSEYLALSPDSSVSKAAADLEMSRTTIYRHWEKARRVAPIIDVKGSSRKKILLYLLRNRGATKAMAIRDLRLNRAVVDKYWQDAANAAAESLSVIFDEDRSISPDR